MTKCQKKAYKLWNEVKKLTDQELVSVLVENSLIDDETRDYFQDLVFDYKIKNRKK